MRLLFFGSSLNEGRFEGCLIQILLANTSGILSFDVSIAGPGRWLLRAGQFDPVIDHARHELRWQSQNPCQEKSTRLWINCVTLSFSTQALRIF